MFKDEKIIEHKTCKHCNSSFEITDKDLEFYEKISPTFNGKKYLIPSPTFCPDCRKQRRLSFRNERKLYKRKCDATGENIISVYSPDKTYKVYNHEFWWSDKWNPLDFGKDFDFSKSFFEQFDELTKTIPLASMHISNSENTEYGNHVGDMKSCYLTSASWGCEKVLFSSKILNSNNSLDLLECSHCSNCYECFSCGNCQKCYFCNNCNYCSNSYFLESCNNCEDCLLCSNLINKRYCINNKQLSKEEYEKKLNIFLKTNNLSRKNSLQKTKIIHKNLNILNCENSLGDKISNCKNCYYIFNATNTENSKYLENGGEGCSNTYDGFGYGYGQDLSYEIVDTGLNGFNQCFTVISHECVKTYYSHLIYNSQNIFGCIGLRNKSYCILNKEYSKEEYEKLVPKIIEHMMKTGEWGEFFPSSISPFGYNKTVAEEYFPLSKNEALEKGFNWSTYEPPFPKVDKIIKASMLPENISDIPDDILNWAIECEVSGKPFRIVKAELDFYRKHNLPIPKKHPDQRHLDRLHLRNPRKLFDRKCDKCGKGIKTSYSPDRKEIVYCESCYKKEVY